MDINSATGQVSDVNLKEEPIISNSDTSVVNKCTISNVVQNVNEKKTVHQCKFCGKCCSNTSNLKTHERMHTGVKPYKCKFCDKSCSTSSNLQTHERIHTGEKPYKCPVCNKQYSSSSNMQSHQRIHLGLRPYVCEVCGKLFTTSSNLMTHRRIHTGARPFSCNDCGKQFATSSNLHMHKRRTHIRVKPFECDICGKAFFTQGNLQAHKSRTHDGIKPFTCEECGKTFFTASNMQMHKNRTHLGLKPCHCDACGKEFSTSSNLLTHLRTHTGLKPYICHLCGRQFTTTSNLKVHLNVHEKAKAGLGRGIKQKAKPKYPPVGPCSQSINITSTNVAKVNCNPITTVCNSSSASKTAPSAVVLVEQTVPITSSGVLNSAEDAKTSMIVTQSQTTNEQALLSSSMSSCTGYSQQQPWMAYNQYSWALAPQGGNPTQYPGIPPYYCPTGTQSNAGAFMPQRLNLFNFARVKDVDTSIPLL